VIQVGVSHEDAANLAGRKREASRDGVSYDWDAHNCLGTVSGLAEDDVWVTYESSFRETASRDLVGCFFRLDALLIMY
jgi:hypothetical protein